MLLWSFAVIVNTFTSRFPHRSTRGFPILGLDVGASKVGVAVSDAGRHIATGFTKIARRPWPAPASDFPVLFASKLSEIIKQQRACALVVGYPLLSSGKEGERCEEVTTFMRHAFAAGLVSMDDDVAIQTPIPYVMWDERMTTLDARGSLWENKRMSKARQKEVEDQVAATLILQSFLSSCPAPPTPDGTK